MASLGKIDSLQYVLSKGKKENVALLHKFVFQYEGDRNSRKRLRNFEGFDFSQDDERFESLQEYVAASFEDNELITICNMLGIDYKADDLFLYIFHNLRKGGLLSSINAVDDTDDESDDDFDDNEDDHKNDTIVQRNEDEDEVNSKTHGNHQYNEDEVKLKSETHCDNQHNDGDDKINRGARNMRQRSMMSQNKTIKNNNELKQSQNQRQKSVENLTVASENIATSRFALNFRDVEDSIRPFSGDDLLSVDVWLNEFEEISTMMQWDDLQKFIFAKRSIKGLARTYIMSERGINNWFKLKNALINEFKESTNSAELHKLMINRKIKKNESLQEYFLNMKELASRGNIEEAALIQYVIDGINDSNINKIILYGAKNLREFKEKLKCYESIFGKDQAVNVKINKKPVEHQGKETKTILCYNCGMKGHVSSNCSNKNKGVKCFNCNKYGHKANECTLKSKSEDVRIIKNNKDDIMLKNIVVGTKTLLSLIDTGSKCHLMTLQTHELLNSRNLQKSHIKLIGFGKSSVTPIGNCYHSVVVDGQSFNLLFHVVPTHLLDVDIIIGQDIVKETDIIIKDNKVTFEKRIQPNQVKGEVDIFNISVSDANTFDIEATVKDVTKNEVEAQTDFLKEANTSSEVSNEVFKDEEVGKSATLLAEEAVHDNNVVNSSENFETKNETKIDKEIKSEEVVNEIKSETADCDEEISENNIEADLNKDILIPNNEPTQVPNNELAEQPNMNNNEFLTKPVEGKVDETIDDSVKKLDAVSEQIAVSEESILPKSINEDGRFHPVYYMSKKTTDAERKYCSYELEVLAIIEALKKFRIYLLGQQFKLVTDCNAFTKTLDKKDLCTRVARWVLFLQEYNYTVEHRPGSQMRHVDALSRMMMIDTKNVLARIKQAQAQDEHLNAIIKILNDDKKTYDDYFLKSGILYKLVNDAELIVVPVGMQRQIISQAHDRGHFATKKTKELICKDYFISNVEDKIQKFIDCCIPCILSNRKRGKQEGLLHPLQKEEIPLFTYHIDFLGPLESTNKNYKHILVVVDAFTKFCWLYATKSTTANEVISKLRIQSMTFGNPVFIISDRGSAFTSQDFLKYCDDENIKLVKTTTGLPRVNGQVERLNAVIISVLTKLSIDDPSKWYKHVDRVQRAINSTFTRSIHTTPFELLVGVKMRTKEDHQLQNLIDKEMIVTFSENRDDLRAKAKAHILKLQDENRKTYNLRRKKARHYAVDDLVAVKRTQFGSGLKLKPKFLGPYKIVKVKSNNAYDVQKVGNFEGPKHTSTCAEYMKPWSNDEHLGAFGANA